MIVARATKGEINGPGNDRHYRRFVGVIAWLQWRTAEEKVRLDLFDRRFAVYDELCAIVGRHLTSGIDQSALFEFARTTSRAQFLFGPKVIAFLKDRLKDLNKEWVERQLVEPPRVPDDQREAVQAELVAQKDRLGAFITDFDELVAPYMKHHQKDGFLEMEGLLSRRKKRS